MWLFRMHWSQSTTSTGLAWSTWGAIRSPNGTCHVGVVSNGQWAALAALPHKSGPGLDMAWPSPGFQTQAALNVLTTRSWSAFAVFLIHCQCSYSALVHRTCLACNTTGCTRHMPCHLQPRRKWTRIVARWMEKRPPMAPNDPREKKPFQLT